MTRIDTREFRNALGSFATGVTIVTTLGPDGKDVGVTANSFNSVSMDPPLVLWSLAKNSGSFAAFDAATHFAVHVLSDDQEPLSNTFAKRGTDKFAGIDVGRGLEQIPLLSGCAARFQCRVEYRYEGGDHVILVGHVLDFEHFERKPLAFQAGRYAYALHKPQPVSPPSDRELDTNWLNYLVRRLGHQLELQMRPVLRAHDLIEVEHYVLQMLMARSGRPRSELDALIDNPHVRVSAEVVQRLAAKGLLESAAFDDDSTPLHLSEAGRALTLRLLVETKSLEEQAEQSLHYTEVQVLKEMLWKLVRTTKATQRASSKPPGTT